METHLYVQIAKASIQAHFVQSQVDRNRLLSNYPDLAEQRATFVTLTLQGRLRGCIGSIIAHRPLIDDLIYNAQAAAFHDPRFPPLTQAESDHIHVEVSLLTHPQPIHYRNSDELQQLIRSGTDGVILRYGNHQATFLPQVWDELSDFKSFFDHLGLKAGIGTDPLSHHPEIYTYQVEKYKEHSND